MNMPLGASFILWLVAHSLMVCTYYSVALKICRGQPLDGDMVLYNFQATKDHEACDHTPMKADEEIEQCAC